MDQVFNEAIRMYPPVVLFVNREASEDTQLGQYKIPAGTNVQIPIWQIHHDAELWPDPFRFDPDRYERHTTSQKQIGNFCIVVFIVSNRK